MKKRQKKDMKKKVRRDENRKADKEITFIASYKHMMEAGLKKVTYTYI